MNPDDLNFITNYYKNNEQIIPIVIGALDTIFGETQKVFLGRNTQGGYSNNQPRLQYNTNSNLVIFYEKYVVFFCLKKILAYNTALKNITEEYIDNQKIRSRIFITNLNYEKLLNAIRLTLTHHGIELQRNGNQADIEQKPKQTSKPKNTMTKNQILYGPPGTGKTYNTINKALEILNLANQVQDRAGQVQDRAGQVKLFQEHISKGQICFITFHQSYGYEEFVEGLKPVLTGDKNKTPDEKTGTDIKYEIKKGPFRKMCDKAAEETKNNYVLIIDEINRGNISKIFGELITLIEPDKREGQENALSVTLPYSQDQFSVPDNLYIIGTMNTADRSLAQLDIALRRRFDFIEIMPDTTVLNGLIIKTINIEKMLEKINERILALYDREHTIGHAYFTELRNFDHEQEQEQEQFEKLQYIFKNRIIPLLQEYFFDDWEKIQLILGKELIDKHEVENDLFTTDPNIPVNASYSVIIEAFKNPEAYISIYTNIRKLV